MVEAVANGVEDKLVDGLSFKLAPGASYVQDRRSVTFHPQGSNIYSPIQGTRMIKFLLSGDNWMDPSTFRIAFDLKNIGEANKRLRPLGGPHTFFKRVRLVAGGQILEDISDYNRVHEMFSILRAKHSRENEAAEGFGSLFDDDEFTKLDVVTLDGTVSALDKLVVKRGLTEYKFNGIPPGQSQRVLFKPLLGILNQPKFLPIRYLPMTIELELVNDMTEPILSGFATTFGADFSAANTSLLWQIENAEVKVDLITLDNGLDNTYAQHLSSGKSLPINYNTFVSQMQTISKEPKPSVNVTRALTRLKSVFVTLDKDLSADTKANRPGLKTWNMFWSPMSPENDDGTSAQNHTLARFNSDGEFNFSIQIGSKLFPEYPIRSHSEAHYQLKKTLGVQSSHVHSFDINSKQYRDYKMVLGIDTEKVLDAGWTGLNTRSGDLMRIAFEYRKAEDTRYGDRMHIVLHSDQIVEIRDTGVVVFD